MIKKKAKLFTNATLNAGWFLISIDTALWLKKSYGIKEVTINTVPNYSSFNLFNLLLRIKNLNIYLNKKKLKKLISFLKSSKFSNNNSNKISDIANFAIGNRDKANLSIDDLEIKFERIRASKKNSLISFLKLNYRVILDYLIYFRKYSLKHKKYLEYQVENIYAGLFVLSEALRGDYKSCGSIFKSRLGILATLYKLCFSLEEYKKIVLSNENINFVIGPSQGYLYGFFSRFMCNQGARYIELESKQHPFIEYELKEKYFSQLKIYKTSIGITQRDKEKISDYYNERIETPWNKLSYMGRLENKYIYNKKEPLYLDGVSIILYLHSFTDAQYLYSYDGYHDLMDWTYKTISRLNSNKQVSKVIVKPHPNIDPNYHPGDLVANNFLKSRIVNFDKVQWSDVHFDVNHIKTSGLVVGITHHGSIAEELIFKGIPVVASTNSPWGDEYKFGYWWNDPKTYENLISSNLIAELKVTKNQTEELYRYAMDRYLSKKLINKFDIHSSWQDMLKVFGLDEKIEFNRNINLIQNLVGQLNPDDVKFKEYIKTRLRRINLL